MTDLNYVHPQYTHDLKVLHPIEFTMNADFIVKAVTKTGDECVIPLHKDLLRENTIFLKMCIEL